MNTRTENNRIKGHRTGLSPLAEDRLRVRLRRTAPSEPWVEAQIVTFEDADSRGEPIICRAFDGRVFPPGGRRTAMRRCRLCGRFTPPGAMEAGQCLDHAEDGNWPPSPSAVAIQALQHYNLKMEEPPLPPESTTALKREIRRHLAKGRR
jgi:hypothetical protein